MAQAVTVRHIGGIAGGGDGAAVGVVAQRVVYRLRLPDRFQVHRAVHRRQHGRNTPQNKALVIVPFPAFEDVTCFLGRRQAALAYAVAIRYIGGIATGADSAAIGVIVDGVIRRNAEVVVYGAPDPGGGVGHVVLVNLPGDAGVIREGLADEAFVVARGVVNADVDVAGLGVNIDGIAIPISQYQPHLTGVGLVHSHAAGRLPGGSDDGICHIVCSRGRQSLARLGHGEGRVHLTHIACRFAPVGRQSR